MYEAQGGKQMAFELDTFRSFLQEITKRNNCILLMYDLEKTSSKLSIAN